MSEPRKLKFDDFVLAEFKGPKSVKYFVVKIIESRTKKSLWWSI